MLRAIALLPLLLAACSQQPDAPDAPQRFAEMPAPDAAASERLEQPLPSPDTARAAWSVGPSGKAIQFGNAGAKPWLTLDCRLEKDKPPHFTVIRHASGFPGQTALFAVMGNGFVSRLPAAATLHEGEDGSEWRWEASLPASDPAWNLFIGRGDMRATLPGKGAIAIPPSPIPGEFVTWCRAGGRVSTPAAPPAAAPAN